jgi:hypothetical protein
VLILFWGKVQNYFSLNGYLGSTEVKYGFGWPVSFKKPHGSAIFRILKFPPEKAPPEN